MNIHLWGRFNGFINKFGYHDGTQKYLGRKVLFHYRINACVEMLKWHATHHSKAEKLNFVLRKRKCSLDNSCGLILKSGCHAENPWKHDIFILMRYLGTRRCHDGSQNFLKRKFETSAALKWRVTRVFWIGGTKIIQKKQKDAKIKAPGLYIFLWRAKKKMILLPAVTPAKSCTQCEDSKTMGSLIIFNSIKTKSKRLM